MLSKSIIDSLTERIGKYNNKLADTYDVIKLDELTELWKNLTIEDRNDLSTEEAIAMDTKKKKNNRKRRKGVKMEKLPKGTRWKSREARKLMLEHIHEHHPRMDTSQMTPKWWKENITSHNSKLLATCKMCDTESSPYVTHIQQGRPFPCNCLYESLIPRTFEESFASYKDKAPGGITLKRDCLVDKSIDPRSVYRCSCSRYYEFKCPDPKCGHIWPSQLDNITGRGRWCPYCSNQTLCPGSANCSICIAKSFFAYEDKAPDEITLKRNCLVDKSIDPREISRGSSSRYYKFKCPDPECGHIWPSQLDNITSRSRWCPACRKKTETFVQRTLIQIYKDDATTSVDLRQGRIPVDGCERKLMWDHRVTRAEHKVNGETDGGQHTDKSHKWATEKSHSSDMEKQVRSVDNNQSLVRLNQEWVWKNKDQEWMPKAIKAMFEEAFKWGPGTLVLLDIHQELYEASGHIEAWSGLTMIFPLDSVQQEVCGK